jgi:hypothetical protein
LNATIKVFEVYIRTLIDVGAALEEVREDENDQEETPQVRLISSMEVPTVQI